MTPFPSDPTASPESSTHSESHDDFQSIDSAASKSAGDNGYYQPFTEDYNPDPDLQADNGAITESVLPSHRLKQAEHDLETTERYQRQPAIDPVRVAQAPISVVAIASVIVVVIGFTLNSFWLTLAGSLVAFVVSLRLLNPTLQEALSDLTQQQKALLVAIPGLLFGIIGLVYTSGISRPIARWGSGLRWDIISALGDFLGAIGQIFIAVLAVYVAWRQYIISRDLTVQQNLITQQQTIDSYFQGISELVLDDEGLLEDWPQERIIAEARTAAILSSVDASGKAKVLRFLSRSKLLTPLARDQRLGRPILDGMGGYAEDRLTGTRVIDLGVMLAASDLSTTDLRWLDLSAANLIRANLSDCDLVRTNFSRAILCDANLSNTDMMGVRLYYGSLETATPRTRQDKPDYRTGRFTGAVVEGADFTNTRRLSETQRCYCCEWGGNKTRGTIPGGCEGIINRLGR
ncbi:Pentapeptide repeat protein [Synechococcus sp. PCC 7335]|uniref:pentapeptide repeat-containing protein n=1 Tax=Synechococcus sp. (strain ATCC 29403 / PCC 7335) TaxID=91464 RepID=UPI00017EB10D|nr:pentapeptide repeat-containing protein [Synechococcus sp. PCC 7335]EDX87585.1 Pentapeptide repeat protein [Synechococcus sp. PCC 7335]